MLSTQNSISCLFLVTTALAWFSTSRARTFTLTNNCNYTVWVGALGNGGMEAPAYQDSVGGWALEAGQNSSVDTADNWGGRFWGRTDCTFDENGQGTCQTGDCGGVLACNGAGGVPPVSLAEFTLQGDQGKDFFDISFVDGFNIPMSIKPDNISCPGPNCTANINQQCPLDLQVNSTDGTTVIACISDCAKTNADDVCCRNAFETPDKCSPPPNSHTFEDPCPQAYSWAYDDASSTFTCTGANYLITFCPPFSPENDHNGTNTTDNGNTTDSGNTTAPADPNAPANTTAPVDPNAPATDGTTAVPVDPNAPATDGNTAEPVDPNAAATDGSTAPPATAGLAVGAKTPKRRRCH